jgi:hypothetical protein
LRAVTLPPGRVGLRLVQQALLITFALHALAMVGMLALLLPGMPGGGVADPVARVAYIADHPWRWRLGWLPWQLTAASDVLLGIALVRARSIPRVPALLTLLATLAAVVPDQVGQALWITRGVTLAQEGARSGDPTAYLAFEARVFPAVAGWGATLYTVGAVGWSWCFAAAGMWSRLLTVLSVVLWTLFGVISPALLLPPGWQVSPAVVSAGNAVGFVLMEAWFLLVAEKVMGARVPAGEHGRWAPWTHPRRDVLGRLWDAAAQSRVLAWLVRALRLRVPHGEIHDIVYVNLLAPAELLAQRLPAGLEVQRFGAGGQHGLCTALTFRHHRIGSTMLQTIYGRLPPPIQSNWRIHVRDAASGRSGVYFPTSGLTSTLHALPARWASGWMPLHVLADARLEVNDAGVEIALDPGAGSGPKLTATLRPLDERTLREPWAAAFKSLDELFATVLPQERALFTSENGTHGQEVRLEPSGTVRWLIGDVQSPVLESWTGTRPLEALAFHVPALRFSLSPESGVAD